MRLLLASASPRRAELLSAAGFEFEVSPSHIDERERPGETPDAYVGRLALAKVTAAGPVAAGVAVLGADTVVVIDGRILGKPADDAEAAAMLRALSGRTHHVLTGVALGYGSRVRTAVARSAVTFADLDPTEVAWYVASGEPRDKAGGYGIQGLASRFVERIDGSYSNVVGLPVSVVYRLMRDIDGPFGLG